MQLTAWPAAFFFRRTAAAGAHASLDTLL